MPNSTVTTVAKGAAHSSPQERAAEVAELKQQSDIQKALKLTSSQTQTEPREEKKQKRFVGIYLIVVVILTGLYFLLKHYVLRDGTLLPRAVLGAILIATVVMVVKSIDEYLIGRVHDSVSEYNLRRVLKLLATLVVVVIVISVLFVNWYTAVVSLGVLSIIAGLALQNTFTSFIGWIYILVRTPYRLDDRIKIGDATGDVIDVGYLDTTLWEFGGDFLSTDHPSGRVIKFPNAAVLSSAVYNYSWPLFPYIWNEIRFNVAYESDLDFVAQTMQAAAQEELGEAMIERVGVFKDLLGNTPVDELQVNERPNVIFRVSENTWLQAIVRYLVPPREAGRIKTRLIKKMLARLNAEPQRTTFPKSDAR